MHVHKKTLQDNILNVLLQKRIHEFLRKKKPNKLQSTLKDSKMFSSAFKMAQE